jgi:hypothetical protein
MASTLFVVTFALVMTGLGWLLMVRLDRSEFLSGLERLAVSFTIGCYVLYLGVFFIAPYRLDSTSMWTLFAACFGVALFGLRRVPWRRAADALRFEANELTTNRWLAFLWILAVAIAASSLIQALAPPNDYDGLAYHLAFPRLDVELGRAVVNLKTGWVATFFPALGSNLTRISLVLADAGAAQMIHGLFGIIGAMAAAALVRRVGYGKEAALTAAILFLSIRMVIWQMGSAETDVPVGALAVLALLVYLATRDIKSVGLEIIFGLMVASTILMKYHGLATTLALVPLILYDLLTRRKSPRLFVIGPMVALVAIMPHLIRDYVLTGNPLFPLMNGIFNPDMPNILHNLSANFGTGRGLIDVLSAPWNIFILPTHYFDGMVIGAPYLLALCPLILLDRRTARKWLPVLSYVLGYYLIWFWLLSQQVRFLAPVMPVLAALAAVGVATCWNKVHDIAVLKAAFIGLLAVLAINQSMFIGIFSIIRLPAAVGLMSPAAYHNKTPTMGGAYYSTCTYIDNHLRDGEKFFVFAPFISYYCPQASASLKYFADEESWWMRSKTPPQISQHEFLRRLNQINFRYFLVQLKTESRGREASKAVVLDIDLSKHRFGTYLQQAFVSLSPLQTDRYSAVYDGSQVLDFLNQQAARQ